MPTRALTEFSPAELEAFRAEQQSAYDELRGRGLSLNLTRGKPSAEQLDLANAMLGLPNGYLAADGTDVRNYGGLQGLPELRAIFGELLGVDTAQIVAGGSSSLVMMREVLNFALLYGAVDSGRPWIREETIKFVCPVPGYDRHFTMLESLGIEMVTVPMHDDGPDIAATRALVAGDPAFKGMWIVPTYANPSGSVCTQEVAAALAAMPTAAPDFKIFWDNAYALHHLTETETKSADILSLASASGHPNRPVMFASTSKVTFAGAGVAFLAASPENIAWYSKHLGEGSIGPDKVNHLRHAQFFRDADGVRAHMAKHRGIIAPKFAELDRVLTESLSGLGIATWTKPVGGYFVSLDVLDGIAARVVQLAKDAGIALTGAGSSFPYHRDPLNRNIRLAPTLPPIGEVTEAMEGVAVCVKLAAAEKLAGA
jgi:DNA-binding transcriptional MocR family regulator